MGCGCKGSSYEPPKKTEKVAKERPVTRIDESYYSRPAVYNGPEPKQSSE